MREQIEILKGVVLGQPAVHHIPAQHLQTVVAGLQKFSTDWILVLGPFLNLGQDTSTDKPGPRVLSCGGSQARDGSGDQFSLDIDGLV